MAETGVAVKECSLGNKGMEQVTVSVTYVYIPQKLSNASRLSCRVFLCLNHPFAVEFHPEFPMSLGDVVLQLSPGVKYLENLRDICDRDSSLTTRDVQQTYPYPLGCPKNRT